MEEGVTVRGECPSCGGERNARAEKVFKHRQFADGDEDIFVDDTHAILRCLGCDTAYFRTDSWFSEDVDTRYNHITQETEQFCPLKHTYHPSPIRRDRPDWSERIRATDRDLQRLLNNTYDALDADLAVLAAIGTRTVFDRASELLGVEPARTFAEKLNELRATGKIGDVEREHLSALVDAGGAAAHRGWEPSAEELDTMVTILEGFLHRSFVLAPQAGALRGSVPPRPNRRPAVGNQG